jgi:cytochrome c biogenesis protein CcdA
MLAAVNPCGFALLPAYLALFIGGGDGGDTSRATSLRRAAVATAAMTGGFVLVFGAFGLVVSPLSLAVERWLPYVTVVIGVVLLATGAWLLAGRELRLPAAVVPKMKPRATPGSRPSDSARAMGLYGVSYAVASLSCTVGPFLSLTTTAFRSGSVPGAVGVFLVYAAGMGAVVGVLTLAVALSRQAVIARIRRALPYVTRASGVLLLVAGGYVAYYGWYELRVQSGGSTDDPVIETATGWQADLTRWLDELGFWPVAATAAVLAAATWAFARFRSRHLSRR